MRQDSKLKLTMTSILNAISPYHRGLGFRDRLLLGPEVFGPGVRHLALYLIRVFIS